MWKPRPSVLRDALTEKWVLSPDNGLVATANRVQPLIDIPLSKAYDVTWAAMEKLVEEGKTKLIGNHFKQTGTEKPRLIKRQEYLTSQVQS